MVLISIHPFALRKLFLVILAFLCFSAFCFADPVLMVHRYSPSRHSAPAAAAALAQQPASPSPAVTAPATFDRFTGESQAPFADGCALRLPTGPSAFRQVLCEVNSTDLMVSNAPGFVLAPSE